MNTKESTILEKNHPLFSRLSFVLQARSTDETRYHMTGLHVEEGKSISTDGRRLHIYSGDTLEEGDYKATVVNKSQIVLTPADDYTYPNWKIVMPEKQKCKIVDGKLDLENVTFKKNNLSNISRAYFAFCKNTDALVNLDFFKDLVGHSWEVYYQEPDKAILFENDQFTAVIMPMQKG